MENTNYGSVHGSFHGRLTVGLRSAYGRLTNYLQRHSSNSIRGADTSSHHAIFKNIPARHVPATRSVAPTLSPIFKDIPASQRHSSNSIRGAWVWTRANENSSWLGVNRTSSSSPTARSCTVATLGQGYPIPERASSLQEGANLNPWLGCLARRAGGKRYPTRNIETRATVAVGVKR